MCQPFVRRRYQFDSDYCVFIKKRMERQQRINNRKICSNIDLLELLNDQNTRLSLRNRQRCSHHTVQSALLLISLRDARPRGRLLGTVRLRDLSAMPNLHLQPPGHLMGRHRHHTGRHNQITSEAEGRPERTFSRLLPLPSG